MRREKPEGSPRWAPTDVPELHRLEWDALSREAEDLVLGARHPEGAGVQCLVRLIVDPAFAPLENWRIFRRHNRAGVSYFGSRILWHRASDRELVFSPPDMTLAEWRYRGRTLSPTIETGEAELPADAVEGLLRAMATTAVPLHVSPDRVGFDGTTYRLRTGDDCFGGAEFRWWMTPPSPWLPLAAIASSIRALITSAAGLAPGD